MRTYSSGEDEKAPVSQARAERDKGRDRGRVQSRARTDAPVRGGSPVIPYAHVRSVSKEPLVSLVENQVPAP